MKRDFDLIRSILKQVETHQAGEPLQQLSIDEGVGVPALMEHIEMMVQDGLIEGEVLSFDQCAFFIRRLTGKGYDFLEHARNDAAWTHVMVTAKENGLPLTIPIITALLEKEARLRAGL